MPYVVRGEHSKENDLNQSQHLHFSQLTNEFFNIRTYPIEQYNTSAHLINHKIRLDSNQKAKTYFILEIHINPSDNEQQQNKNTVIVLEK